MTDTSKTDKAAFRLLLAKLEAARKRDAEEIQQSSEELAAEEARFRDMLLEDSGGTWTAPQDDELPDDGGKIVSLSAHRAAQAMRKTEDDSRGAANDFDDDLDYRLAASSSDGQVGWTRIDLRLRLPDRVLEVYVNPFEDGSVFVRALDCAEGWTGLRLGGFSYELAPSASDPVWIGIEGCDETTLRKAAKGGQVIDATTT